MYVDLDPGLTLVRQPSARASALHQLVIGHLHGRSSARERMRASGCAGEPIDHAPECYWIDARNTASTHVLYDLAPSRRLLDGLRVARAFTAYQHHALVEAVVGRARPETALLVAPNVAALYRDDDLPAYEREDLLCASLATLYELASAIDAPALVTVEDDEDDAAATVAGYADREIECTHTREGWRVDGPGVDQDGYWHRGYWQTTIPYWVDRLGVGRVDPVWASDDWRALALDPNAAIELTDAIDVDGAIDADGVLGHRPGVSA